MVGEIFIYWSKSHVSPHPTAAALTNTVFSHPGPPHPQHSASPSPPLEL